MCLSIQYLSPKTIGARMKPCAPIVFGVCRENDTHVRFLLERSAPAP